MKPLLQHLASLAALGLLSACATLSSNIGGDFSCPAPKGRCAPASVIDAEALSDTHDVRDNVAKPLSALKSVSGNALAARTGETILKIVLPAHVDKAGLLRDEASVYAVVSTPQWVRDINAEAQGIGAHATAKRVNTRLFRKRAIKQREVAKIGAQESDPAAAILPQTEVETLFVPDQSRDEQTKPDEISSSREASPLTLREAVAGASLPAIEGFASSSPARTPQPYPDDGADLPTPDAIAAARAGHRIGSIPPSAETGSPTKAAHTASATRMMKATTKPKAKRSKPSRAKQRGSTKGTYRKQTYKKGPRS